MISIYDVICFITFNGIAYLFNLKIVQDNYFKGRVQRIKEMLKILKCWVTNELYLFNYTSLKDFLLFDIIFERYCNMIHLCKILGFFIFILYAFDIFLKKFETFRGRISTAFRELMLVQLTFS